MIVSVQSFQRKWVWPVFFLLAGLGLFFILGGFQFRDSRTISYAATLRPLPEGTAGTYTQGGEAVFQAQGAVFWWTRVSVQCAERFAFSLWDESTRQWGKPFCEFEYSEKEFGDKHFFRKPILIPGAGPQTRSQIRCEFFTVRTQPEYRAMLLEANRPARLGNLRDSLRILFKLVLIAYLLWGVYGISLGFKGPGKGLGSWSASGLSPAWKYFLAVWAAVLVRLLLAAQTGISTDLQHWLYDSEIARQHLSIYTSGIPYNYSAIFFWIAGWARRLGDALGLAFSFTFRGFILLADAAVTCLVIRLSRMNGADESQAFRYGLFYALNPVILAVFVFSQMDAFAVLGILGAWYFWKRNSRNFWSALGAGLSLAWGAGAKFYAILLAPKLFQEFKNTRSRWAFVGAWIAGWCALILASGDFGEVFRAIVTRYQGTHQGVWSVSLVLGIAQAANAVWMKLHHPSRLSVEVWLNAFQWNLGPFILHTWILLAAWGVLYAVVLRRVRDVLQAWVLICLTFFVFGQNVVFQYFSWPLAAALIAAANHERRWVWIRRFSWAAGGLYFLGLLVERNLLQPLVRVEINLPWTASWLLQLVLSVPVWVLCCVWWWREIQWARENYV